MFFTVIIPTYNPKAFLEQIISSIYRNECKDDIEILIMDDCSEELFDDEIKRLKSKYNLNIRKYINKEHFGAPMLGRQNGINKAEGDWICFADQDDYWLDNAFDLVKDHIVTENIRNYCRTDFFLKHDENTVTDMINTKNWTHGKFYERDFLKKYKIKYPKVKYCEDICLSVLVECVLTNNKLEYSYYPCFTYVWVEHEDSLSKANGLTDKSYFYKSFYDYIQGTFGVYIDMLKKTNTNDLDIKNFYNHNIMSIMAYMYYYFQGILCNTKKIDDEYYALVSNYFKQYLQFEKKKSSQFIKEYDYKMMSDIRNICFSQVPFIEQYTFKTFINKLVRKNSI